jgi:hypothetical protein
LRPGARFCDICGADCSGLEAPDARSRRARRKHGKNGCVYKLILLILLFCVIAAALFIEWGNILSSVQERVIGYGRPSPPAAVSDDVISEPPSLVVSVDEPDTPVHEPDVASEDAAPPEVVPASPVSDDAVLPVPSQDLPESSADVAGAPRGMEIAWAERDRDGYSFLTPLDGFLPAGETLSLPGAVSGDHVRVRARPSIRGRIRRQLDNGVSVDVTGRYSSGEEKYYWFQIRGGGEAGWIYGEFLRVTSTDSEVPEELRPPAPVAAPASAPANIPAREVPASSAPSRIRTLPGDSI